MTTPTPTALGHDAQGFVTADDLDTLKLPLPVEIPPGEMLDQICGHCEIPDCFAVDVCPLIEYLRTPAVSGGADMTDATRGDMMGF